MRPFRYERATDAASAVALVSADPDARFLGGGTNLVDLMKLGVERPGLLVDVSGLERSGIEVLADGGLRIGAQVRNSDLAVDPLVRERFPVLSQALLSGASGQLRNAATVGGNLLQRTRCLYFQDVTKPCNKRAPGTGCPARAGEHRDMAILGTSDACIATHPSDLAVALTALDARVNVVGVDGVRTVPVTELYRLPGAEPERDTVLQHGELIERIDVPPSSFATRSAYRKVRDRASFAFALVSVAAALDVADGAVQDVRVALGGVAPRPWRATSAEAALRGRPATAANFVDAISAELEAAAPLPGNAFKVPLARNVVARVLEDLAEATR
ncbi:MAG TPA: xanthine dehydrogenase family protein subunit M [Acidimicrobiia bacterium]|nr:xanthine dehydrogenase family protein subunit M [Acidimicrobiia bacterium]